MTGWRKFGIGIVFALIAGMIAETAVVYDRTRDVPSILYALAVLAGVFVAGNAAEWLQRRMDASSIAEQTRAEK